MTLKRLLHSWKGILIVFFAIIGWVSSMLTITLAFWVNLLKYWYWWIYAVIFIAIILSFILNWPKKYFEYKLKNKDVYIWVKIWNIFKWDGSSIIPINNKFDILQNWKTLKAKSVLNSFILNHYDWSIEHLQQDINSKITVEKDTYEMWETVEINHKNKKFYLVVNSKVNSNSRSHSTKEDFSKTITYLLDYLSTNADKDEIINIPLLNSWHWRISDLNRTDIIKEIIHFFIEMIKNKVICDKFIIYIYPDDIRKWAIDMEEIKKFLEYNANNYRNINYNPITEWTAI